MTFSQMMYCLALFVAGLALFQYRTPPPRKLGLLCFWLTSGLTVYWLTNSGMWAAVTMGSWVALPMSEVVIVLRRLRVPRKRDFKDAPAPIEAFPHLRALTHEIEELGFRRVDDCDLAPGPNEQFYRLFVHEEKRTHAAIGCVSMNGLGFHFISFMSESSTGRIWVTWDYPLTYGLKMPPAIAMHRVVHCDSVDELWGEHLAFLELNGMEIDKMVSASEVGDARDRLGRALARQLEYNLREGILHDATGEDLRYSWRGILFVAEQIMRDLVRL